MTFSTEVWPNGDHCFTYALNQKGLGHVLPGSLKKSCKRPNNPGVMHMALYRDGFQKIEDMAFDPTQHHLISAFMMSNVTFPDYHFLRLDKDGTWSHKSASCDPPRNTDDSGKIITEPQKAYLLMHDTFVGIYRVPDQGIVTRFKL